MDPDRIDRSSVNSSKISETISWLERERKNGSSKTVEQDPWPCPSEMSGPLKAFIRDNGKALSKGKLVLVSVKDMKNRMQPAIPDEGPLNGISENEVNDDGRTKVGCDGNGPASDQNDLIAILRSRTPIDGKMVEMDVKGKDGPIYLMVSCLPLPEKDGPPGEMLILTMDVTEMKNELDRTRRSLKVRDHTLEMSKKELEAAIARSELLKELNDIAGSLMGAGTFIMDTGSGRIMGSEVFNSIVGLRKGERSDLCSFIEGVHEEDRNNVRSFLLGPHGGPTSRCIEFRSHNHGKTVEKVFSMRTASRGSNYSNVTVMGVIMDITSAGTECKNVKENACDDVLDQCSMFDRERRMIELKEEVNVLMRELGRPEKYPSDRV